jgi:hypothetical protein
MAMPDTTSLARLAAELRAVRPSVVVALRAVAGQPLFGSKFSVTRLRGVPLPWPRRRIPRGMVADLIAVRELIGKGPG